MNSGLKELSGYSGSKKLLRTLVWKQRKRLKSLIGPMSAGSKEHAIDFGLRKHHGKP